MACAWGIPRPQLRERAIAELHKYGVADVADSTPDRMSGGQSQRVALVAAIAQDAPLLLVDEPTSNLDEANARRVIATLKRAAEQRVVVVASHDDRMRDAADRVVEFGGRQ